MEQLSYEQIKEILNSDLFEENALYPENWMHEDIPSSDDLSNLDCEVRDEVAKLGAYEMVEQYGGEGDGDDYYAVYHFKDHGVYVKFQGWYASHHGSEFSEMEQVFPQQVAVTRYLPKKAS